MTTQTKRAKSTARIGPKISDDYFELINRFPLVPIRDNRHLKQAQKMIDELSIIDEDQLTQGQAAYLAVISDLTLAYESPAIIDLTRDLTGLDFLKHLMQEHDLTASDVGRIIGQRELGPKLLRGDRQISKEHAKQLGKHFGIPSEIFLRG
jgi:HTH-type transcriptional regulator/antitoxin HigA